MKSPSHWLTRCLQISAVFTLGAVIAGACPSYQTGTQRWENCTLMIVYPDTSLGDIPAGTGAGAGGPDVYSQINSAVTAWYNATSPYYPTVYIVTDYPGSEDFYNVKVIYAELDTACGLTTSETYTGSGPVVDTAATITFDSSGYCTDPTNAAYQNFYLKEMMHELGHLFFAPMLGSEAQLTRYSGSRAKMAGRTDIL